jgi:hypothetical protein
VTLSELTWILTALAAVVVLITRIRLGAASERPAGRLDFSRSVLTLHTAAGVVALGLWVPGLILGSTTLAMLGVAAWWVVTVAGLLLLTRWLPAHGKHSGDAVADEWTEGPWLSLLGHLGMLGGALYFTWAVFVQGF